MARTQNRSVIGVDGGGTNCRFAMLHQGRRVDFQLGSANASSDLDAALATLRQGLSGLAGAAGLALSDITDVPTFIGLAGVLDQDIATALSRNLPLTCIRIEDDRRPAMVGALGASDGYVIGIGTGSFLGRRAGGVDRLIGGWGLILGDEASGAYLGRQLLRRVLQVADGIHEATPLTREMLTRFRTTAAIVAFATKAKPGDFAQFAPRVVTSARSEDPFAVGLMQDGARYISRALDHLGWRPGDRICPLGGLAPFYGPYLAPDISAHMSKPEGTALDGALSLAAQMTHVREPA